jgi:hypothetical protein
MAVAEQRTIMTNISITLRTQHDLTIEELDLVHLLGQAIAGPVVEFPHLRIAPDSTINYLRHGHEAIFDLYGNGAFLRNRITGETFRVGKSSRIVARGKRTFTFRF